MDNNPPETVSSPQPPLRENLIATAVMFLQNPNVARSALDQKRKYLLTKGLTEEEIEVACQRAGVYSMNPKQFQTVVNMSTYPCAAAQPSLFLRVREALHSVAIFGAITWFIYWLYRTYIEPFLFGRKRRKSVRETVSELDERIRTGFTDLNAEVAKLQHDLDRAVQRSALAEEILTIKAEVEAVKGILLSRKQFSQSPHVPPSIPAWQLISEKAQHHPDDKNDDNDTGSGSSETEVVTKNSDSSLEIM
ncbi:peroxisomal membrane protein PEX14 [Lutzomyia longipalpis]|uniref:peroxisomal membrane protein PEX14 n=1 Tax=Lutzomyia longipalpis TaxID=7200 RepID=UPI0024845CB5|nr:peroxisomal membrane protein PEX14 [Lutzomyia longipalpis]